MSSTRPWIRTAVVFCAYALVCNFVPSEPFLTPYLLDVKHFTEDQLNNEIYSVSTYAFMAFLFVVGPAAEFVGYRYLIMLNALAHMVTRAILVWATSLAAMQAMQVTYGLAMASEVIYFSYVYKLVDASHYQRLTSLTRASTLLSRVFSGILAQVLVSQGVSLVVLFYIAFATSCGALVISLFFPFAPSNNTAQANQDSSSKNVPVIAQARAAWKYIATTYSDPTLLALAVLWSVAQCGIFAIEGYASSLWYAIDPTANYNGIVDSAARLAGAGGALLPVLLKFDNVAWLAPLLTVITSVGSAGVVIAMSVTGSLWVCYVGYISFEGLIYCMMAILAVFIAARIEDERFAVVFGLNTFAGAVFFTILQLFIATLNLSIELRFYIYSGYFGLVVIATGVASWLVYRATCPTPFQPLIESDATLLVDDPLSLDEQQ